MKHINTFLHMGGYASFVWSAYAIAAMILIVDLFWSKRKKKQVIKKIKRGLNRAMKHECS